MGIVISQSTKRDKFDARIDGKETISFGGSNHNGFTKHKDSQRKDAHLARHKK